MENHLSQGNATISDETSDNFLIYKLFSNPTLLETLKQTENIEIFAALKPFCIEELQVCIYYC